MFGPAGTLTIVVWLAPTSALAFGGVGGADLLVVVGGGFPASAEALGLRCFCESVVFVVVVVSVVVVVVVLFLLGAVAASAGALFVGGLWFFVGFVLGFALGFVHLLLLLR